MHPDYDRDSRRGWGLWHDFRSAAGPPRAPERRFLRHAVPRRPQRGVSQKSPRLCTPQTRRGVHTAGSQSIRCPKPMRGESMRGPLNLRLVRWPFKLVYAVAAFLITVGIARLVGLAHPPALALSGLVLPLPQSNAGGVLRLSAVAGPSGPRLRCWISSRCRGILDPDVSTARRRAAHEL